MKYRLVRSAAALFLGALMVGNVDAGWGSSGGLAGYGSSGGYSASYGSSGGYASSYGSSGGYASSYGSSGGYASSYGSSGGYSASYGSSGGYGSYRSSGGSSGGRVGIVRRTLEGIHDHLAAKHARHVANRAARRSYYGSSGYSARYGSSGGSSGYSSSYGSSGGYSSYGSSYSGGSSGGSVNYGSTGYSSGVSYGSTGGAYYGASNTSSYTSPLSLVSDSGLASDTVNLTVAVPSAAKIFVNGKLTTSTGSVRQFISRGLESGKSYRFEVRAEMDAADGSLLTEEKEVVVTAGSDEHVQFAFADSNSTIETAVTLNVPEGAEVTLAGSSTKASGMERTFRTDRLLPGEVWDDYQIEVKLGDQVKRQSIRLIGGDKLQLTFNFDDSADKIASR